MDIPKLVDSCCAQIVVLIKGSSDAKLEEEFGIPMNMTTQEEQELKEDFSYVL